MASAVEVAVTKRDAAGVHDCLVEVVHGHAGFAHRLQRLGVERIVLRLDRAALAHVPEAGEALGDEPAHACVTRGGQERVGALDSEPVRLRERPVQVLGELHVRQGGRLVDDRVRLGLEDCLAHGIRVEQVEHDGFRAERTNSICVFG